ncbi:NAD(P)-dependent oxidoreductase [Veronia pacifica]|uniref:2-hydroxy-3-oxopropionate reductase n=1 Tax=Veronia pacifica TaxID=1080227 RepID=A0A1C3EKP6_9GAMM|nr:NAD(P)-dependent oxidoreductase [Veronia pacifica]ODA33808.1 2-hydroxy-3-oxopropionate reductase [Veronia pacifica]
MSQKVAFIGLGNMGFPMAGHLSRLGSTLKVFNRSAEKALNWRRKHVGQVCASPAEAAKDSDVVFICVGNDNDVRDVVYGERGVLETAKPGTTFVDHTTTSAQLARELADVFSEHECQFVDAPVSGGQAGAEAGQLAVMAGGNESDLNEITQALNTYSRVVTLMGPHGSGQLCKMVNQICVTGVLQSLSEGVNFALRSGLDIQKVFATLSQGAAGSWQMANRASTMANDDFDFGFAIEWMIKDLTYCLDEGHRIDAQLPLTEQTLQRYEELAQNGDSRSDISALIKQFNQKKQ